MSRTRKRTTFRNLALTAVGCSLLAVVGCGEDYDDPIMAACMDSSDSDEETCQCFASESKSTFSDKEYDFVVGIMTGGEDVDPTALAEEHGIGAEDAMSVLAKMGPIGEKCGG